MQVVNITILKSFEALKDVPDGQLQWLIDCSTSVIYHAGDFFLKPEQPLDGPHFIIGGSLTGFFMQNGGRREITTFGKGEITGYLPYSRGKFSGVYMQAVDELQVLSFPTVRIREMIRDQFELTQALVHVMSNRVRTFTALQQQNEKMMALGKLSAGLAHELNNPASAILRDSLSLKEHLKLEPENFKRVIAIKINEEQVDAINHGLFDVLAVKDRPRLSLKERTRMENDVSDWLDEQDVENSYDLAENFVSFNFDVEKLKVLTGAIPAPYLSPILNWINTVLITEKMVEDIQESSKRIADLVSSVKTFTHMDRGTDKQYADIHIGIGNTLTMLGYKVRHGNIALVEEFDNKLPPVKALIGELNQVWTNLIDNALDAMEVNGKGTLTIKTEKDREFVQVTIQDDGPGIPEDELPKIFDPFFTTKEIGKGTGLGLEVVQRIVHQHNGTIKVKSKPGQTAFVVCFPIDG